MKDDKVDSVSLKARENIILGAMKSSGLNWNKENIKQISLDWFRYSISRPEQEHYHYATSYFLRFLFNSTG
jgi:hypothetical protein